MINSTFLVGGTVVLMERFDPAAALHLIDEHAATMFEGVPAMYAMMLSHPDLAHASPSARRSRIRTFTIEKASVTMSSTIAMADAYPALLSTNACFQR